MSVDYTWSYNFDRYYNLVLLSFSKGGEDYKEINRDFTLRAGRARRCVPIIILEDQVAESDESFTISIQGTDAFTTVTIADDDCKWYYPVMCAWHLCVYVCCS